MKIERDTIPTLSIERFAEENDLVMEIHERRLPIGNPSRYYACFKRCELMDDGMLVGMFGNGASQEDAIKEYSRKISLGRIVINAFTEQRREIVVPRLTEVER